MQRRIILMLCAMIAWFGLNLHHALASGGGDMDADAPTIILATGEEREVVVWASIMEHGIGRIYYISAENESHSFCVLDKQLNGEWTLSVRAPSLLPCGYDVPPLIAFDDYEHVYITYYPNGIFDFAMSDFSVNLALDDGTWYVTSVSWGHTLEETGIFVDMVVNLETHTTYVIVYDTANQTYLRSDEKGNKLRKVAVTDFILVDFLEAHQTGGPVRR